MYQDLHSRGYVIIPSFLSAEELELFQQDFSAQEILHENKNYDLRQISIDPPLLALKSKIETLMEGVRDQGIKVDFCSGGAYFSTAGGQEFKWHQDHESYYMFQEHYHYLNLYIPVIKPSKAKTNLAILPFDVLQAKSSELYDLVVGRGATSYEVKGGITRVYDNDAGGILGEFPFDLNAIAVVPELEEGDLLMLRGDMIHATADTETERCAASIRLLNSRGKLSKRKFFRAGKVKLKAILNNRETYNYFATYMSKHQGDEFEIIELMTRQAEALQGQPSAFRVKRSKSQLSFKLFMLINRYLY